MKISGKIADNLRAAVESARRFRGQRIHQETLDHWEALLAYAKERQRKGTPDPEVGGLISKLQSELAQRRNAV